MAEKRVKGTGGNQIVDVTTWLAVENGKVTGLSAAKTLADAVRAVAGTALGIPAGVQRAVLMPETQGIRWLDNGETPTAAAGFPVPAGSQLIYDRDDLTKLKFIEMAVSSTLWVAFLA